MTNAELIKALRYCKADSRCGVCEWYKYCESRKRNNESCLEQLHDDAADALEAADEKIAELERQLLKEGERDATNVNGNQSDEDKTVMDCSYCPSADGCLEAFSKSTLCPRVTGEQMKGEHDED